MIRPSPSIQRTTGSALIIALSLLILITFLVVAFFSKSTTASQIGKASVSLTQTGDFGRGVLQVITEDVLKEVRAASDDTNPPY